VVIGGMASMAVAGLYAVRSRLRSYRHEDSKNGA
jgi:hypothetical protein